jgi:hypothetical protein
MFVALPTSVGHERADAAMHFALTLHQSSPLKHPNVLPMTTKLPIVALVQHGGCGSGASAAYDCIDGTTYNSHFFIRIAILEMMCTALPRLV